MAQADSASIIEHPRATTPASKLLRKLRILEAKRNYDLACLPDGLVGDRINKRAERRQRRLEKRLAAADLDTPETIEDVLLFVAKRLSQGATYIDFGDGEIDLYAWLIREAVQGLTRARFAQQDRDTVAEAHVGRHGGRVMAKMSNQTFADLAVLWRKQVNAFNVQSPSLPTDKEINALADATYQATEAQMVTTPIVTEADVRAAGNVLARETRDHVFGGMPAAIIRALRHHQRQPASPAAPAVSPDLSTPTTEAERDLLQATAADIRLADKVGELRHASRILAMAAGGYADSPHDLSGGGDDWAHDVEALAFGLQHQVAEIDRMLNVEPDKP